LSVAPRYLPLPLLPRCGDRRDPHSFPTRRSSDLGDPEAPTGLPERFRLPDSERTRLAAKKRDESIEGLKRLLADLGADNPQRARSEEHTSELQSREKLVCRLLLEKKKQPVRVAAH